MRNSVRFAGEIRHSKGDEQNLYKQKIPLGIYDGPNAATSQSKRARHGSFPSHGKEQCTMLSRAEDIFILLNFV